MNIKKLIAGILLILIGLVSTLFSPVFYKWFTVKYKLTPVQISTYGDYSEPGMPVVLALAFWCILLFLSGLFIVLEETKKL